MKKKVKGYVIVYSQIDHENNEGGTPDVGIWKNHIYDSLEEAKEQIQFIYKDYKSTEEETGEEVRMEEFDGYGYFGGYITIDYIGDDGYATNTTTLTIEEVQ